MVDYKQHKRDRSDCVTKILACEDKKRLVLAGPGTGKSYLFQQVCVDLKNKGVTGVIAMSFINELVSDLKKELYGLAEVKTLHSFALGTLPGTNKLYLYLAKTIADDYLQFHDEQIDYEKSFRTLKLEADAEQFYWKRRKYYGHFSPDCSVYALTKFFDKDSNSRTGLEIGVGQKGILTHNSLDFSNGKTYLESVTTNVG